MASRNGLKFLPGKLSDNINELLINTAKPFYRSFQKSAKLGKFLYMRAQQIPNVFFFLESIKIDFEIPNSIEIPKDISNVMINVRPSTSIVQKSKFDSVVRPRTVQTTNFPKIINSSKAHRSLLEPGVSNTNLIKRRKKDVTLNTSRKNGSTTSRSIISTKSGKKVKIVEVRTKAPTGYMSNFKTTTTNTIQIPIIDFTKRKSIMFNDHQTALMPPLKKEDNMIVRLKALELLKTPRNIFKPSGGFKMNQRGPAPEYFYNLTKNKSNFNSGQKNNWNQMK